MPSGLDSPCSAWAAGPADFSFSSIPSGTSTSVISPRAVIVRAISAPTSASITGFSASAGSPGLSSAAESKVKLASGDSSAIFIPSIVCVTAAEPSSSTLPTVQRIVTVWLIVVPNSWPWTVAVFSVVWSRT